MKHRNLTALVAIAFLAGLSALAHEPGKKEKPQGHMGMGDMMKECREHCQATTAGITATLTSIDEAQRSNDTGRMRSAVDAAEKSLREMRDHMTMCMKSMDMMGQMHGGMGGMHGGPAMQQADPVCGMAVDPKTAPQTTYQGRTYYFCSAGDKARFEKDPESFLKKSPQ